MKSPLEILDLTSSSALSTALRAVSVFENIHKSNVESGWAAYKLKISEAPTEIRETHNAIQMQWSNDPSNFSTNLTNNWNAWEKTVMGDIRVLRHSCGNALEKLLRDWAVLPDQALVSQIFQKVGLDEHVLFSLQNPRKTTLKCFKFRPKSKVPGRRPGKKRPRNGNSNFNSAICKPPSDRLLLMIQNAAGEFRKLCPSSDQQDLLVQHERWNCLNNSFLSLKIPFEQYQNFAIRTGINKQIQEKTFRDTASESSEHMHRRKTTMGMRGILDKFHNVGDGGRANKRQRKE